MVKMQLDLLTRAPLRDRTNARVETTATLVMHTIQSARSLMFDLSPPMLHEIGLGASLEWLAEQLQRDHQLAIGVRVRTASLHLPLTEDMRTILFLVIRELLLNVVKHAHARAARVTLSCDDTAITAVVSDNGCGFSPGAIAARDDGSFGLFSVRERLRQYGGSLRIASRPGRGTVITIAVPVPAVSSPTPPAA